MQLLRKDCDNCENLSHCIVVCNYEQELCMNYKTDYKFEGWVRDDLLSDLVDI